MEADFEPAEYKEFKVAGKKICYYPIIHEALNFLQEQKVGVRYEKKLGLKDAKRLISGELSLEEFENIKAEMDQVKTHAAKLKEEERADSMPREESRGVRGRARGKKAKSKDVWRCRWCASYRLRVVDCRTTTGQNMLCCGNRKCLASIELTDKPAGTQIEAPWNSGYNFGWMMASKWNNFYPSIEAIEKGKLSADPEIPDPEDDGLELDSIFCPGQISLTQIM